MLQLIYSSVETHPFGISDLKHLLVTSRLRNKEAGVTGMLIYDRGKFLQALEGDVAAVSATYARIERDSRHANISVLVRDGHRTERQFGEWSMGYFDASQAASILRGFVPLNNGLNAPALDRSTAVKIMQRLAQAS